MMEQLLNILMLTWHFLWWETFRRSAAITFSNVHFDFPQQRLSTSIFCEFALGCGPKSYSVPRTDARAQSIPMHVRSFSRRHRPALHRWILPIYNRWHHTHLFWFAQAQLIVFNAQFKRMSAHHQFQWISAPNSVKINESNFPGPNQRNQPGRSIAIESLSIGIQRQSNCATISSSMKFQWNTFTVFDRNYLSPLVISIVQTSPSAHLPTQAKSTSICHQQKQQQRVHHHHHSRTIYAGCLSSLYFTYWDQKLFK